MRALPMSTVLGFAVILALSGCAQSPEEAPNPTVTRTFADPTDCPG